MTTEQAAAVVKACFIGMIVIIASTILMLMTGCTAMAEKDIMRAQSASGSNNVGVSYFWCLGACQGVEIEHDVDVKVLKELSNKQKAFDKLKDE